MDAIEALLTRRSVRKYNQKEISRDLLEELIRCGMYAPSACNKRPWHFIILSNKNVLNQITAFHPHAQMLKDAACAILVCGDETKAHTKDYWPVDCSAATQNILLAAHALGLGACWVGIYPREERIKNMKQLLNLPEHIHAFSLISIGYSADNQTQPNRFDPSMIHLNAW